MTTRRFFFSLALALGVIVAFNIVLAYRIDSVSKLIMRRMEAAPKIDILFLGNSLMQSGLDPAAFTAAWPATTPAPPVFNAGLGSSSPVEHYLLAHQAYLHHDSIPVLVYGFYDLQLTQPPEYGWADLTGNKAMAYSTEPVTAAELYAPGSLVEKWRFLAIGAVPMLREHSQLWKYVEILRRSMGEVGLPKAKTNQFGRTADFEAVAFPDRAIFDHDCESDVQRAVPFVPAVAELLHLAQEKQTRVVIVEMPMTSEHRAGYYSSSVWQNYRTYLQQKCQSQGITYLNASDWVPDDTLFSDGLHLNETGAKDFSTKIAQALAQQLK